MQGDTNVAFGWLPQRTFRYACGAIPSCALPGQRFRRFVTRPYAHCGLAWVSGTGVGAHGRAPLGQLARSCSDRSMSGPPKCGRRLSAPNLHHQDTGKIFTTKTQRHKDTKKRILSFFVSLQLQLTQEGHTSARPYEETETQRPREVSRSAGLHGTNPPKHDPTTQGKV
jgi:hypothetical protein